MTLKTIKGRITSVSSTKQIMKAMNLVATARFQKDKAFLETSRPFFTETVRIMDAVENHKGAMKNLFAQPREIKNTAYVVITSDRGLCGGYNINAIRAALASIAQGKNEKIIAVGKRGWEYFRRHGKNVVHRFPAVAEATLSENAEKIGGLLASLYASGEIDEAYVVYTQFKTVLSHEPIVERVLPLGTVADEEREDDDFEYIPEINVFLEHIVPMYLNVLVYGAMAESVACEQASRMTSMDSAANNAEEIIEDLTISYNRIRQNAITQEISEIVNGANAKKQRRG